ncbi:putative oxidoreductase,short chain dehydrogenase [Zopfia rhizophila CBS 207.26]|uniref:Putative oxidoreductase,short chain dehydrogenase n=1 Tax=Zopfia rhizophila CBS 207.26 TaxID=1314779 RepID=A0A6A6DG84_9PEZI|nr:putative oxidoreductase,short chain dehydrogenase [Zopfia rhizophila CBS 207.26]
MKGGSSGIGLAIAEQFTKRRAHVVIGDLNEPSSLPPGCTFVQTDVVSWQSQLKLFQGTVQTHGHVDIVCANAGIMERTNFQDIVDNAGAPVQPTWRPIVVNLIGMADTTKLAIHFLLRVGRGGQIILTSSLSGYDSWGIPTYAAAKHGVIGLMQGLRDLLPRLDISINCIAPGFTESGMAHEAGTFDRLREAGVPVQQAKDVAAAALYFASHPSVKGETLTVIGAKYFELEKPLKDAFIKAIQEASSNSTRKVEGGKGIKLVQKYFYVPL